MQKVKLTTRLNKLLREDRVAAYERFHRVALSTRAYLFFASHSTKQRLRIEDQRVELSRFGMFSPPIIQVLLLSRVNMRLVQSILEAG